MSKLLRTSDRILLGIALLGDIFNEVKTMGGLMGNVYQTAYGYTPRRYKKSNYYNSVSRMVKSDLLKKEIDRDGQVNLIMTSKGKYGLSRKFPLISLQNKPWDGKWRIVTFDIPEKHRFKRDNLRNKLKELGFGMIQKSVWVSPHGFEDDMCDFIESQKLSQHVYVFVSGKILVEDIRSLVNKLWNLEELNMNYENYIQTRNTDLYFQAILKDPFLPKELMYSGWLGQIAKDKFLASQKRIRS